MLTEQQILDYIRSDNIWNKYITCGSYKQIFDFDSFVVASCENTNTYWIRHIIDLKLINGYYFYSNDPEIIGLMKRNINMGEIFFCVMEKLNIVNEEEQLSYILEKHDVENLIKVLDNLRENAYSSRLSDAIDMFTEQFPIWGNAIKSFPKKIMWFDLQICNFGFRKNTNEIVFFDIVNM